MRLKASTDFGLRALMRLAAEPDRAISTKEMAKELKISRNHLTKVIQTLVGGGFVVTQRGSGGGAALARSAHSLTLGEAVRLMEADQAIVECFRSDGGCCNLSPSCKLKGRLANAREAFLAELDRTTLAECAGAIDAIMPDAMP